MPTPAGYRAFSALYRFEPEGLVFSEPVSVTLPSRARGADVELATLFWSRSSAEGGGYSREGGLPREGSVEGEADHFSFGFIADGVDYTEAPDRSCVRTRMLDARTLEPSGLGVFVAMDDCWGRPITDVDESELLVLEDGVELSSEAMVSLYELRGLEVFITLAIDVSASTQPILDEVIAAARTFVETINEPARGLQDRVQIGIRAFAGEESADFVLPHTLDLDLVLERLDALSTHDPSDVGSTNLHGALVESLDASEAAQVAFRDRNLGGAFTTGYVLLFADGLDSAGRVDAATARTAVENSTDDVVAVGLRTADYDPDALRALIGDEQVIDAAALAVLDRDFAAMAARIAGQVERTYLLGYCSPKRSGLHTVGVGLSGALENRMAGVPPEFDASGFAGGCATMMFDPAIACGAADCGGFGCGACDDRESACVALGDSVGSCVSNCVEDDLCRGEAITNRLGYLQICPESAEATYCSSGCVDTRSNVEHCGECDNRCWCQSGRCALPVQLSVSGEHSCALMADGRVYCWGNNLSGQLGNGSTNPQFMPTAVSGVVDAVSVAVGTVHSCVVQESGHVLCWGGNGRGQLGNGTTTSSPVPTPVHGVSDGVEIAAGPLQTCVRRRDGSVMCWGHNAYGELGDGTTMQRLVPTPVSGVRGAAEVSVGGAYGCARLLGGSVVCWGSDSHGQLGDGGEIVDRTSVRSCGPGLQGFCQVGPCTGISVEGSCGSGPYSCCADGRLVPVEVSGLADAVEVTAGVRHSCARRGTGEIVCWGDNEYGQLGNGGTSASSEPSAVRGIGDAVAVSASFGGHTCALRSGGLVMCWGDNRYGQLGDGTTTTRSVPTDILELHDAVEIAAGQFHTCALRSGGVACWGRNRYGLGDGTSDIHLEPVPIP